jgi:hypothetical protein
MKKLFIISLLLLISFSAYSQFIGGNGGGSDKAQIRTRTILSLESEQEKQEKAFFENVKIASQSNSFSAEWNDKITLKQIEIIDILGRIQKTVLVSEFQKAISFPFDATKGVYFVRFRDDEDRFFSSKIFLK